MADIGSALVRIRLAEARLKRAVDLSQSVVDDVSKQGLFRATVRDLPQVRDKFEADFVVLGATQNSDIDLSELTARMDDFEEKYFEVMATVSALEGCSMESSTSSRPKVSNSRVALPKITLPSFEGSIKNWPNFSNLFCTLVANNSDLSSVEKLAYLKTALSGEPLSMIQALPMSEVNFDVAWKLLVGRYENKRLIVSVHVEALLQAPSASADSPKTLRQLLNTVTENVSALKALSVPVDQWDLMLLPILCKRLDAALQTQWEMTLTDEFPTLSSFTSFLEKHCRAHEAVIASRSRSSGNQVPKQTAQGHQNSWRQSRGQSVNTLVSSPQSQSCLLCSDIHVLRSCPIFSQGSPKERYAIVKEHKLCLNCLSPSHRSNWCPSKSSCHHCKARHHSMLHFGGQRSEEDSIPSNSDKEPPSSDSNPATVAVTAAKPTSTTTILLSTAQVQIFDRSGVPCVVRALLDTASQASFITEQCLQRLRLVRRQAHLPIHGLSSTPVNVAKSYTSVVISPVGNPDNQFALDVFVLPRITNNLPSAKLSSDVRRSVAHLKLADPSFDTPGPVDLLIGADLFPLLVTGGKIEGSPVALDSVLGWILMGRVDTKLPPSCLSSHCVTLFTSYPPLDDVVRKFWEIEEFPRVEHKSPEDVFCETMFAETHVRNEEGRYSVSLPFRHSRHELGTSRPQAINRLMRLERRLKGDSKLKIMYSEFMEDYLAMGHMEKIPDDQIDVTPAYYIPHHCVVKPESSTTKLRVVFDGSAKSSSGVSLNDTLLTGPKLQRDIFDLLLNFRLHAFVFTADVKQMYRQISVLPQHQDYQRIVWRFCDSEPVQDYRLKTVTYGVSSAPFLALRTLQQLAVDEKDHFPVASRVLQSDVYVDDVVTGSDTLESALAIQKDLRALLAKGGFKLRKFMSNHTALIDWLPPEDVDMPQSFDLDPESQVVVKVLGLQWNPVSDTFSYVIRGHSSLVTKRSILANVARIFDPLGWLTPLLMFAKHLLQLMWVRSIDWDDHLPPDLASQWDHFSRELPQLSSIAVARFIKGPEGSTYQLHGFCDSSEIGYAAVVYLRIVCPDDRTIIRLLISKSKVAPVKSQTLPRLELCGALLLARVLNHVIETYQEVLPVSSITAWTDSQVVLAWINSSPHQLKTFVANRVSELQELTRPSWWKHVPSEFNPADCASRGLFPLQLLDHHLWWTGPPWLIESPGQWPSQSPDAVEVDPAVMEKKTVTLTTVTSSDDLGQLATRFSRLTRLLRVTCCLLRFAHNCRVSLKERKTDNMSPDELNKALHFWLFWVQSHHFKEDISALKKGQCISPQIRKLVPFLDDSGLIRVGGRLAHSSVPFEQKHPVLLPKSHHLTDLIINHYHEKNHHPGVQTLRGILREQFWILADKDAISRCLRHCVPCFKQRPVASAPLMGDLPSMRVQQVKPFAKVGVDYAGPFMVKLGRVRGAKVLKAYLCIFVCCATKAVHAELASDLSTDTFIGAYKRFLARRGRTSDIYSDCGTNFVGTHNRLKELQQLMSSAPHQQAVTDALSQLGVMWHFNPPAAPHFGGLWEAGVKSFKTHLSKVIGEQVLTFEELYTLLVQVEATLNSRPLCPLSSDPNDISALTPGHFLTLEPLVTLPEPNLRDVRLNRLQRWQLVERLQQDFWHRWHRDYLHTLQQRQKWNEQGVSPTANQLVLLKDDRLPPLQWRLGRIVELYPGKDGVARVATIRTSSGTLKRPVVKLCPLPYDC
ncbi:uncharacterized protein LOC134542933 [Bacillus rossius redtenbacheri]|uniref:uncharacterized protein LOC134542933 n=1 Tax=Bacillus rossius redtenbacheri TaxID=93214 RepID=UPI002FDDCF12